MARPKTPKRKISRYTTPKGPEAEFQPGARHQVLRNRLGITMKREMDRIEYEALVRVQGVYLKKSPPTRASRLG